MIERMKKLPVPVIIAAGATAFVLLAQAFRLPSALVDAATGEHLRDFALAFPLGHLLLTPFSALADWITFNSARQDKVLVFYLLTAYWAVRLLCRKRVEQRASGWRGRLKGAAKAAGGYLLYLAVVVGFLAWATLSQRPAARLLAPHPDDLVLDFHSHTNRSHDGRSSFSSRRNMEWHRQAGFSAAFITDHNVITASAEARQISREEHAATGYRSLFGEEVSLYKAHIVALAPKEWIYNRPYDGDIDGLRRFLGDCGKRFDALCVLSLPEYWLRHWGELDKLVDWGAKGIEIVNSAPKGLDFPAEKRRQVVELCRRRNLFMDGATDNHGWSRAAYVWNVMRIPAQAAMGPDELEKAVSLTLRRDGFSAVRVVTRVKHAPAEGMGIAFDPVFGLWTVIRAFT
ncbi:MAG: hypothetical protein WCI75_11705, partial [candidate division NC10 bacterium]